MSELYDNSPKAQRALLVGIEYDRREPKEAASLLRELSSLASSLGLEVTSSIMVKLRAKTASLLLGTGKADEIIAAAKADDADSIIFDHPLSPMQQRNLEKLSGKKVYDRAELIIKIFSARALTKEASIQVELARLEYSLPRLAHSYEELSRQRGGRYGTKGSGEQKIELDRRSIERRIHELEEELKLVRKSRDVQRKRRERLTIPRAAIVGYTNAGKSSLLNVLAKAEVVAEDKLFATLDPTTRRLVLGSGASLLLTDTVGFVRNLPHGLVEAFKATLEEASSADLLIHVADAADPEVESQMATTEKVLTEIGAGILPRILVLNKTDIAEPGAVQDWLNAHPGGLAVSARTGEGLQVLVKLIEERLSGGMVEMRLIIPHNQYALIPLIHREGVVIKESSQEEASTIVCRIPARLVSRLEAFKAPSGQTE